MCGLKLLVYDFDMLKNPKKGQRMISDFKLPPWTVWWVHVDPALSRTIFTSRLLSRNNKPVESVCFTADLYLLCGSLDEFAGAKENSPFRLEMDKNVISMKRLFR